ncbi:alpha-ketoglutarate-dependent dioxygenase AlkB family protein [Pseudoroseicyclus aestuarii]|uniref:DNA alkylation damage repair protein AlkB n=1 Tax=Pseudoroseicyclus aestuarii TaxID=1795041 RepID=A0A318SR55_9RHOB|nr:alpha-ketoglutarate-dependent dioxygenase AlkB [Pseudoroseicyclus aestuarii]PYE84421.1 DNA alkylation damage repair protein AlkB [Pseudoroseicyclus aestuarii]
MTSETSLNGARILHGYLGPQDQAALVAALRRVVAQAPFYRPVTRRGPMSVRMTAAGRFGWVADRRGYRYEEAHPETGQPWPAIPQEVLAIWNDVSGCARAPECCLVNLYRGAAKMGLHQDKDEADFDCPVVSISLGDEALFRVGQVEKPSPSGSVWLRSGDVAVLGGPARLAHHGIDRVRSGSSSLLEGGGRINLTLRVVT